MAKLSMSNISKQHDGDLDIQTNEIRNVSMLIAPTISCWEAGRWELTRARLQRSSDASLELTSSIRGHFEPKQRKPRKFRGRSNESFRAFTQLADDYDVGDYGALSERSQ